MWTKKGPGKTIFPYVWNNLVHSALSIEHTAMPREQISYIYESALAIL